MSNDSGVKKYCYKVNCGPVVMAGFHHEFYPVCKECKCEISDTLKYQIEERNNEPAKPIIPDDEWPII